MLGPFKAVLLVVCAAALAFVGWRFILPLVAMHLAGVGVAIPLPKRFVRAFPKLAIYLFVVGGPLIFVAVAITFIWLLRLRIMPRQIPQLLKHRDYTHLPTSFKRFRCEVNRKQSKFERYGLLNVSQSTGVSPERR